MEDNTRFPLVSIVITTYNRAELLPRAINSALLQTYPNIEIIVVNDGSTDSTGAITAAYLEANPGMKYISHEFPRGGNAARNSGILAARGEFIAGLDDDDEFLPGRISLLMAHQNDKYSIIASRSLRVGKKSSVKTKYAPYVDQNLMFYYNAVGNQVLVKRSILLESGLFDEKLCRCQDYDMWLRIISRYGGARILKDITQLIYCEHDGHSNDSIRRNFKGTLKFYTKHKYLMTKLQRKIWLHRLHGLRRKSDLSIRIKNLMVRLIVNYVYCCHILKASFRSE